ncbi:aminotransferase class IV [Segniliparus rotundus DSM 44985]|uniref:Aminotransferase class IV n=1 Tax=Segniliparus rotundus (strain ATCC BAA-972 / CDC 1076 / CIP 108378 / DSM 44985 / JCM 13578) TaxID=640132 RepID=D6ZEK4_SEGRD|nr:aminodeoxychorismate lyase [Segniliparus rotundus]ADG99480.1 aminotransferase class IV [Segniliparus rotundus DSM 44985]
MPTSFLVSLDGQAHDPSAAFLHVDDLAALRGDGVFETVLVRGGTALKLDLHLERLAGSARRMGLPVVPSETWAAAVAVAVGQWDPAREGVLRLVLSRGRESVPAEQRQPTGFVYLSPVPEATFAKRAHGVSAVTLERGFPADLGARAPWLLLGAKTLSYAVNMAALRYAAERGAAEAIFLDAAGQVLEGPTTTVVLTKGNKLVTPVPDDGILHGTTMRALFRHAEKIGLECVAEPLTQEDLRAADGVWLTASITLASRVRVLDGEPLRHPDGALDLRPLVDAALA